ncbi:cell wall anchor protein [Flavobacterium sp. TR2]|uniref:cell wall anchor protein n=1 Tax=Flavobacterium sp. TR2 TaxID=2977321 RepID=UPI0021B14632|nr:cell wall anchor protein [Flavobacterium sp. TR2]UWY28809.1 cell wall anchor protein [Flavobacterium sp. TR2]
MEQFAYPTLTAFFGALITWLFSKRKNLAENRAAELDNAVTAVKYYREMLDDMATRLTAAYDTIKHMEIQHKELMLINQQLVDELQKFKQLNGKTHDTTK